MSSDIATLAFNAAVGETAKTLTKATLEKIDVLRKKIWDLIRGKAGGQTALEKAESGSKTDLETVAEYLQAEMVKHPSFATEIEKLAREIDTEINIGKIQGQNLQNVYGGEAQQNNANNTNAERDSRWQWSYYHIQLSAVARIGTGKVKSAK